MTNTIKIAYHSPTEKFKHIDSIDIASKGLLCGCVCLKCNELLVAVVEAQKKIKHFRHRTNINCEGSQETALHELGKQILQGNFQIIIPEHGAITYLDPVPEKRLGTKRPDISATFDGQPIFFEIYVSHAVDSGKEEFFVHNKYRSIEIDLRECRTSTFEEIKNPILNGTENKKVFYWEDEVLIEDQTTKQDTTSLIRKVILVFLAIIVAFKIFRWLTKPRIA